MTIRFVRMPIDCEDGTCGNCWMSQSGECMGFEDENGDPVVLAIPPGHPRRPTPHRSARSSPRRSPWSQSRQT